MDQSTQSILSARQVGFSVDAPGGRLEILKDISLDLNAGETLAIVGASGSGKTTLLGLLAGLDRPTSGDIRLTGAELKSLDENARARLRKRHVGFVFQSFHLLPSLTALENVMLALEIAAFEHPRKRALEALDQVGLSHRLEHYPRQLSGGEQQRVAIARAFAGEPEILFADEPTGNLDQRTGEAVADLLFELNEHHGTALVLVTHDMKLARRCGRVDKIEDGVLTGGEGATEHA
ncbi:MULTISPECIES: ABC transporter ATP-binding protein [unclassified Wenzhouxiangella]|uniref:ABC transporter ATP-binding protein n=1 Tax=unclassified Wenzhouxiangella TaxID=2613841 RepID=UPI000E3251FA|nr:MULTISPECIES: ATP-binding cassette domain-containing protein [unclassified Wenzhouxiangella]RFF27620.1 ATP-binding cassette domain-containing protein [Wenzhouxiangella sp. 15181]RFP70144.1 ATP-binding cassette domain-containing protein [Wenzhouxiangella sp. 15190]